MRGFWNKKKGINSMCLLTSLFITWGNLTSTTTHKPHFVLIAFLIIIIKFLFPLCLHLFTFFIRIPLYFYTVWLWWKVRENGERKRGKKMWFSVFWLEWNGREKKNKMDRIFHTPSSSSSFFFSFFKLERKEKSKWH